MADTDSTLEVQKAIVATLKADSAVSALVGSRVYDAVPAGATFPYVELGAIYGQPAVGTQGGEGFEIAVTLDFWSRARGRVEAARIMAAAVAALNNAAPSLDSKTIVMMRLADQRILLDQDGVTTHGVQRWTVVTDG